MGFADQNAFPDIQRVTGYIPDSTGGIEPKFISGLKLWLKADAITGVSNGAALATWPGSEGTSSATQASATSRPTYVTGAYNGLPAVRFDGTNDVMATSSIFSAADTEITVFAVTTKTSQTAFQVAVNIAGSPTFVAGSAWFLGSYNNNVTLGSNRDSALTCVGYGFDSPFITTLRFSSGNRDIWLNSLLAYSDGQTVALGVAGALSVGGVSASSLNWGGDVCEVVVFNRALTDAEVAKVNAYLTEKWVKANQQVYFVGDSITAGLLATSGNHMVAKSSAPVNGGALFAGWGVSGRTAAMINTSAWAELAPFVRNGKGSRSVLVLAAGLNDINTGVAASTVFDSVKAICAKAKAAGMRVVYVTPTPANYVGITAGQETRRQAFLKLVLADRNFADAIADVGNDPVIGLYSNTANATYYPDGVHWSNTTCDIAGPIIGRAIRSAMGQSSSGALPVTLSKSASVDFGSTADGATATATIEVLGAVTTNTPSVVISGAMPAGWDLSHAYVSATDTVTIVARNRSGGTSDPAAVTLRATVMGF